MLNTPVLFLIFNRPDTTALVFEQIRLAKPKQLFVAADGPRPNVESDIEKCKSARDIIKVDWDCELKTLYRDENLGCGIGPASAISWFFKHIEQGIILEDDCLPAKSFFKFCEELLIYYKNVKRIMHITGTNYQLGKTYGNGSYYFSHIQHCTGWATWKDRWQKFDFNITNFSDFIKLRKIKKVFKSKFVQKQWLNILKQVENGKDKNIWDYQWTYSIWDNNGIAIVSNFNMITNIGFRADATHTTVENEYANLEAFEINQIIHPKRIKVNKRADKNLLTNLFKMKQKPIFYKIKIIAKTILIKLKLFNFIRKMIY